MKSLQKILILFTFFFITSARANLAKDPELISRWGHRLTPAQIFGKDTKFLVVVTMGTRCPLVRKLIPTLNEIHQKYSDHGIQLIGLFSPHDANVFKMADFATELDVAFPVFLDDPENPWVKKLNLETTPQVAVINNKYKILYRGAVDDSNFGGGGSGAPKNSYLINAIMAGLSHKPVSVATTAASGCRIAEKVNRNEPKKDVTFYRDIYPIIQNRCQGCHRSGELAGEYFTFDNYDEVSSMMETILDRVQHQLMPPWHATIPDDKKWGKFIGDLRLPDSEISLLQDWYTNGMPAGNSEDQKPGPQRPEPGAWEIGGGKPEFIFQMAEPYQVPKKKLDEYQYYRVVVNESQDRWIKAVQLRPGNLNVVHHMGALLAPHTDENISGHEQMIQLHGITGESARKIADYVTGDPFNAHTYPQDEAIRLPANHDVLFEIHYTPTGQDEQPDQSSMGIVWTDKEPKKEIINQVFTSKKIRIPPGAQHYRLERYVGLEHDSIITSVAPHMHFRGKSFTLYRVYNRGQANEKREVIYRVPN